MPRKAKTATAEFDSKVAKVIAAEMVGTMTAEDAEKFVTRLGRLAASMELIAPAMNLMGDEMEVRRKVVEAAIRRENPSTIKSVFGAAVGATWAGVKGATSVVAGMASSLIGLLPRKNRADLPQDEWSLPMLKAELERKEAAAAEPVTV